MSFDDKSETDQVPIFRFAPSPNGRLHLGHAYSALFTERAARDVNGTLLLRIEDIDTVRSKPELIDGIIEDLDWLGIEFNGETRRQSEHFDDYRAATEKLNNLGVLYPCQASRNDIKAAIDDASHPRDPDDSPIYPGLYRDSKVSPNAPYALRLNHVLAIQLAMHKQSGIVTFTEGLCGPEGEAGLLQVQPEMWGDVVIVRKDTPSSYNLSVVVDDALQGVTHITRGQDLFYTTHIHRVLQTLMDLPEPHYFHHELITDDTGRKLSKSAGDRSLKALRDVGVTPADIRYELGFM
ncbi:MAG: tRNA glutamyl-Q(34) synthetase GluQRS [Hyphomicrobiales bacterium]